MKRDPEIRRLVRRGYLNLALFLAVIMIGLAPTVLFPGLRGISIALIVCGTAGIGGSVRQLLCRRWSRLVSGTVGAWSVATLTIGLLLITGRSPANVGVQVLLVFSLGIICVALPTIIQRGQSKR